MVDVGWCRFLARLEREVAEDYAAGEADCEQARGCNERPPPESVSVQTARSVNGQCTVSVESVYSQCTVSVQSVNSQSTVSVESVYSHGEVSAQSIKQAESPNKCAVSVQSVCSQCAVSQFTVSAQSVHSHGKVCSRLSRRRTHQ